MKNWLILEKNLDGQMLINQIATFVSNKSVLYLFSVIDYSRFNFGGKFKFIDFRENPTFSKEVGTETLLSEERKKERTPFLNPFSSMHELK